MVKFKANRHDMLIIRDIVTRALREFPHGRFKAIDTEMDLFAVHLNGCPLDLQKMLDAPLVDLAHDLFGIQRYLDRDTGKLTEFFVPRYSLRG